MTVKICGISDIETALFAIEHGATAIGFVFAESKRKVTTKKAKEIISQLPREILKVGVFVNESKEEIEKIIRETGINAVQLHGDETPEFANSFSVPVIKAFGINNKEDLEKINAYSCQYILLDSPKGKYRGGNGTKFDWDILVDHDFKGKKVILAGGLHEANVETAIKKTSPFMIDVSSGVETDGKKDLHKIKSFLEVVKKSM